MAQYFYKQTGNEHGPVSLRELATLVADGTLDEQTAVREQSSSKWTAADEIPGLMRSVEKLVDQASAVEKGPGHNTIPEPNSPRPAQRKEKRRETVSLDHSEVASQNTPEAGSRISSILFIIPVVVVAISAIWLFTRPSRFPAPSSGVPLASAEPMSGAELPLAEVRAPAVDPASINIPVGIAQPVPGLEGETGLSCPALSDDLKTIVFVKAGPKKGDDVFLARRDSPEQPFGAPVRLECSTRFMEAFCSLSPNGSQLVFTTQEDGPSRIMLANSSDNFLTAKRLVVPGTNPRQDHVDNPQWLDEDTIRVVIGDTKFTRRSQVILKRQSNGDFSVAEELRFQNPWPRMHLSRGRERAYFQSEAGILLATPKYQTDEFGMGQVLAAANLTGAYDQSADDPLFVVPKEDIIFFTGPGPGGSSGTRKLWMIRP